MMKKKAFEWINYNTEKGGFSCSRCGGEKIIPDQPIEINDFIKQGDEFLRAHRKCKEKKSEVKKDNPRRYY